LTTPFNFVGASNTSRARAYFNAIRSAATVGGVNAQAALAVRGGWAYDDFNYKMNARTTVTQSFRMFNNLSNTGQYRMNVDAVAATRLMKWLTWNIGLSDRSLSAAVLGHKKNDFLYTTGVGFSFAR
jgi:hypothetical protein